MSKIRGIKPDFWTDKKIVSLKIPTRLFFIGLWNFCDDQGVFEWEPLELKMKIFPADTFDTTRALRELVETTCIYKFNYKNKYYGIVLNFSKHQRPDKRFFKTTIKPQELANILKPIETTTRPPRDHHDDIEGEGEGDIENSTNVELAATPQKSQYGNIEINKMLEALKGKVGVQAFVDSSNERNMAKHCVGLMGKIGAGEFVRRLDILLADSFHQKNCNKIKYIYNQIKGFIEPKNITVKI